MPSTSSPNIVSTARSASVTAPPALTGGASLGSDDGRVQQKAAATKYRAATTRIRSCGLARATRDGPNSANPRAKDALVVSVNRPLAAKSCPLGNRKGIIDASAGPKKVVTV